MNDDITDPKHVKIATYTAIDDETLTKVTNSYFDTLTQTKEEIIKSIKTDHNNFLSDIISCLDVINNLQTKELNIKITVDEWNKPSLIVKQYTTRKEDYKRR
jgi:alpha-L-arabinofuranosidase